MSLIELDAIVIVDADSTVSPDLLRVFARGLDAGHEWIQCYDCVRNADESWRTRLMAYAFSLINGVTLLGQSCLGLSAALRGNGMCLSTRGLDAGPVADARADRGPRILLVSTDHGGPHRLRS